MSVYSDAKNYARGYYDAEIARDGKGVRDERDIERDIKLFAAAYEHEFNGENQYISPAIQDCWWAWMISRGTTIDGWGLRQRAELQRGDDETQEEFYARVQEIPLIKLPTHLVKN